MAKKKTPEQRAKEKASYHLGRSLGLSSKEAKSPARVRAAEEVRRKAEAAAKAKAKAKKPRTKRKKKQPEIPGVKFSPKKRKDTSDFESFVIQHPEYTSARKAKEAYRKQTGRSITNAEGDRIFRNQRESQKRYDKARFPRYTFDNAPFRIKPPYKDRYYYVVRYEVERETQPDSYTQYLTLTSPVPLGPYDIVRHTYEYFKEAAERGFERYKALRIVPDSVVILYEIDLGQDWRRRKWNAV